MEKRVEVGIIMFSLKSSNIPRGCFIVFCGLDGSGKSTLMEHVHQWLEERRITDVLGKHPPKQWMDDPAIYNKYILGDTLQNEVDDYYEVDYTCRLREELQSEIMDQIRHKKVVLYHRYIYSLFTYYNAVQTVDIDYITKKAGKILKPDLVFYTRVSKETFYERSKSHGILSFQKEEGNIIRMIEMYDHFAENPNWIVVDTEKYNSQQCFEFCLNELKNHMFDEELYCLGGEKIELF